MTGTADTDGESVTLESLGANRFRLAGTLDFQSAASALAMDTPFDADTPVKLDAAALSRIDSAGLAVLLAWWRRMRQAGGALRVENPPDRLAALIRIAQLEDLLLA